MELGGLIPERFCFLEMGGRGAWGSRSLEVDVFWRAIARGWRRVELLFERRGVVAAIVWRMPVVSASSVLGRTDG